MTRRELLLEMVAMQYDLDRDPFSISNLSTHKITGDECHQLSRDISTAIRVYLTIPPAELAKYLTPEEKDESILTLVTNSLRTREIRKKLEDS